MKVQTNITHLFVLLGMLAGNTLTQTVAQRFILNILSLTPPNTTTAASWSEDIGKTFGVIWKVCILICFALLILDAVFRFVMRKKLLSGLFHSVRFIWFIYGSAAIYALGTSPRSTKRAQDLGYYPYRVFNDNAFGQFFEKIYDAYFGSGFVKIFNNKMRTEGNPEADESIPKEYLLENALFFELIIFIGIRIAALVLQKGLASGSPLSNFIGTIRRVFGWFVGPYFFCNGIRWLTRLDNIADTAKIFGQTFTGRANFNVWLSWAIAIYCILEGFFVVGEVFFTAFKSRSTKSKAENYQETSNPSGGNNVQRSYDACIDEVTFMFQKKDIATQTPFNLYYNSWFMLRWALYIFFALALTRNERATYYGIVIADILTVIYTVFVFKSFTKLAGIIILVSEVLLILRHLSQLIFYIDQYGSNSMGQGAVDFLTHLAFWSYLIGTFTELFLIFEPFISGAEEGSNKNMTPSKEFQHLDKKSEHKLAKRVEAYKSIKSSSAFKANKEPKQNQNSEESTSAEEPKASGNKQSNPSKNNQRVAEANIQASMVNENNPEANNQQNFHA